jgi:hypothetical protein
MLRSQHVEATRRAVLAAARSSFGIGCAQKGGGVCRTFPRLARALLRLQLRSSIRPQLLIDAAEAIPRFDRLVLLIWGQPPARR